MLNINSINPNPQLSTALGIYFARLALPVWQKKHPKELRPEKAIKAAEKALFAADAYAADAYAAAAAAAYAANAAYAAYAAGDAAYVAGDAANAARSAANAARSADADAAYFAAAYAADALGEDKKSFIHHHLQKLLPIILWHKLNSNQSFGEPERIFELLPERCKEDFLFHLDSLR